MLLAELELFLSRPVAPTRRVALGDALLPMSPAPGLGGLLLGAVVASFIAGVDPDLHPDLVRLTRQLEAGQRIAQPRLRHRLQDDRIGLTSHRHRLLAVDDRLHFDLDVRGNPAPHVLGAIYAAARLDDDTRASVFGTLRRALAWRGSIGPGLVAHLGDRHVATDWAALGGREPRAWALAQLGLDDTVETAHVQRRFRELLRAAHPDHGGRPEDAAERIDALSRARRILLQD